MDARDAKQVTPLHIAASGGHVAALGRLLELGHAVGARDAKGRTPLHHAAKHGRVAAVQALVRLGAFRVCQSPGKVDVWMTKDACTHAAAPRRLLAGHLAVREARVSWKRGDLVGLLKPPIRDLRFGFWGCLGLE